MKIANTIKMRADGDVKEQIPVLQNNLDNIFRCLNGRVRFGTGVDGARGENIAGEFQRFTSDVSANTEFSVTHTIGAVPIGYIVIGQDKAGSLYQLNNTGTSWTSTTIYLKCSVSSVTFWVFLIQ